MILSFSHQNPEILLSNNAFKISKKNIITFMDAITIKSCRKVRENYDNELWSLVLESMLKSTLLIPKPNFKVQISGDF